MVFLRVFLIAIVLLWTSAGQAASEYRVPQNPDVVRLLTASPPPEAEFNAASGRIALIYRESLVPVDRISRPHLALAGFSIDPGIRTSGYDSRVKRVEVLDARTGVTVSSWLPAGSRHWTGSPFPLTAAT